VISSLGFGDRWVGIMAGFNMVLEPGGFYYEQIQKCIVVSGDSIA
jgi:hypothetical protein